MKLSDKLKQHRDLIEDQLRGDLYKIHEGPAGGIVFMQHDDGTFVECWTQDEPEGMTWDTAYEYVKNLNYGGYNDWSLPNKNELDELYMNKDRIGNLTNYWYWSDNEYSEFNAWYQAFNTGAQNFNLKSNNVRVRAVRRFK